MKFEDFEKKIWDKGYGIVAMNHYSLNGKRHTYVVILNKNKTTAIQAEAENSEDAFQKIYSKISEAEQ